MPETGWAAWLAAVGMVVVIYGLLWVVSTLALWGQDRRRRE